MCAPVLKFCSLTSTTGPEVQLEQSERGYVTPELGVGSEGQGSSERAVRDSGVPGFRARNGDAGDGQGEGSTGQSSQRLQVSSLETGPLGAKGTRHFSLAPPSTLPHSVSPSCDRSSHGATQLSLGLSELLSDQSGECQNPWSKARLRLSAEGMCQECSEEAKPLSYQPPLPPLQVFGKLGEGRQDPRLR